MQNAGCQDSIRPGNDLAYVVVECDDLLARKQLVTFRDEAGLFNDSPMQVELLDKNRTPAQIVRGHATTEVKHGQTATITAGRQQQARKRMGGRWRAVECDAIPFVAGLAPQNSPRSIGDALKDGFLVIS